MSLYFRIVLFQFVRVNIVAYAISHLSVSAYVFVMPQMAYYIYFDDIVTLT